MFIRCPPSLIIQSFGFQYLRITTWLNLTLYPRVKMDVNHNRLVYSTVPNLGKNDEDVYAYQRAWVKEIP